MANTSTMVKPAAARRSSGTRGWGVQWRARTSALQSQTRRCFACSHAINLCHALRAMLCIQARARHAHADASGTPCGHARCAVQAVGLGLGERHPYTCGQARRARGKPLAHPSILCRGVARAAPPGSLVSTPAAFLLSTSLRPAVVDFLAVGARPKRAADSVAVVVAIMICRAAANGTTVPWAERPAARAPLPPRLHTGHGTTQARTPADQRSAAPSVLGLVAGPYDKVRLQPVLQSGQLELC